MPDAAEVHKRKGTEEGQQRVSQSSVVLPTLTSVTAHQTRHLAGAALG